MDKKLIKPKELKFVNSLKNKPIIIWGARMTGLGLLRFSKKHNLKLVGYVDGDPSLTDKMIGEHQIKLPSEIKNLKKEYPEAVVVVAAAPAPDPAAAAAVVIIVVVVVVHFLLLLLANSEERV